MNIRPEKITADRFARFGSGVELIRCLLVYRAIVGVAVIAVLLFLLGLDRPVLTPTAQRHIAQQHEAADAHHIRQRRRAHSERHHRVAVSRSVGLHTQQPDQSATHRHRL